MHKMHSLYPGLTLVNVGSPVITVAPITQLNLSLFSDAPQSNAADLLAGLS